MENIEKKTIELEIKSLEKNDDDNYEAIITSSTVDRDSDVVLAEGLKWKDFFKTGATIFYNHDQNTPIGKANKLWKFKDSIKANFELAKRPKDFEGAFFPDFVRTMVDQKMIKGVSISFKVDDHRLPSKKDYQDYGKTVKRVITKSDLYEFSVVTLPCNTDAVIKSISDGSLSKEQANKFFGYKEEKKETKNIEKRKIEIEIKKNVQNKIDREIEIEIKKKLGILYY